MHATKIFLELLNLFSLQDKIRTRFEIPVDKFEILWQEDIRASLNSRFGALKMSTYEREDTDTSVTTSDE